MRLSDLALWQHTRETYPTRASAGAVQLCGQDPRRVVLVIGLHGSFVSWISTKRPAAANSGLAIGVNDTTITDAANLTGSLDADLTPVTGTTAFTAAPGTGSFAATPGNSLSFGVNNLVFQGQESGHSAAPSSYVWTAKEHGILCQSEWWAWDVAGGEVYYVLEALQERDPCAPNPGDPYAKSISRGLWTPHRRPVVDSSGDHLDAPPRPQPAPRRRVVIACLPQSLLDLLRPARRVARRSDRLPWQQSPAPDAG